MDYSKIRVLVVDDMGTMRKIVAKSCREAGFVDIIDAADGQLAWAALCESKPAVGLIISDWNMPNCSGLDLLKRVRADGRFKHLPFMLVTAESEAKQVAEAMGAGVDNYIVKPFQADALKTKIEETFKRSEKRAAA